MLNKSFLSSYYENIVKILKSLNSYIVGTITKISPLTSCSLCCITQLSNYASLDPSSFFFFDAFKENCWHQSTTSLNTSAWIYNECCFKAQSTALMLLKDRPSPPQKEWAIWPSGTCQDYFQRLRKVHSRDVSKSCDSTHEFVLLFLNWLGVRTSTDALILVVQLGLKVKMLCWILPTLSSSSPHNQNQHL